MKIGLNWVIWHVTNKCNITCTYCFTNSSPKSEEPLSDKRLLDIAERINASDVKLVTLIGGEPFTLDILPKIVEKLLEVKGRCINIDTNGTFLKARWHEIYEKVGRINVSIDDISKESHDLQRGGYKGVINAISFLSQKKLAFSGNITVTNKNYKNLYNTAKYLLDSNASIISFSKVKPIGRGANLYNSIKLNASEELSALQQITDFYTSFRDRANILATGFYNGALFENGAINKMPSCMCGDVKVTIAHNGSAYPCEAMPFVYSDTQIEENFGAVLNIADNSLSEIIDGSLMSNWRANVYSMPDECGKCSYNLYCNKGCRLLNFKNNHSFLAKDTNCQLHDS